MPPGKAVSLTGLRVCGKRLDPLRSNGLRFLFRKRSPARGFSREKPRPLIRTHTAFSCPVTWLPGLSRGETGKVQRKPLTGENEESPPQGIDLSAVAERNILYPWRFRETFFPAGNRSHFRKEWIHVSSYFLSVSSRGERGLPSRLGPRAAGRGIQDIPVPAHHDSPYRR